LVNEIYLQEYIWLRFKYVEYISHFLDLSGIINFLIVYYYWFIIYISV